MQYTNTIGELERLTRNLIDVLDNMDPTLVPLDLMRDLEVLRGRVEVLSNQRTPVTGQRRNQTREKTSSASRSPKSRRDMLALT